MRFMHDILSERVNKWTKDELKKAFSLLTYNTADDQLRKLFVERETEKDVIQLSKELEEVRKDRDYWHNKYKETKEQTDGYYSEKACFKRV